MKTILSLALAAVSLSALAGVRIVDLDSATTRFDKYIIPSRSAQIVGFEAAMFNSASNGTTSLSLNRNISASVPRTSVTIKSVETQDVVSVKSLANNYTVAANYYAEAGAMADAQVSTFSNCYASTSKGENHGEKGASRITFTPGSGTATTTYPTNYMVRAEFFGNYWYTNFVWDANSTEISLTSPPTSYPIYRIGIMRRLPPIEILQTNRTEIIVAATNTWTETVSRSITIPLVASTQTTNGYHCSALPADTYIFDGDSLSMTSPAATNNPGKVRVFIKE